MDRIPTSIRLIHSVEKDEFSFIRLRIKGQERNQHPSTIIIDTTSETILDGEKVKRWGQMSQILRKPTLRINERKKQPAKERRRRRSPRGKRNIEGSEIQLELRKKFSRGVIIPCPNAAEMAARFSGLGPAFPGHASLSTCLLFPLQICSSLQDTWFSYFLIFKKNV